MDDLAGLDWTSSSSANKTNNTAAAPPFSYPTLRPTPPPLSGRSTPSVLSAQASGRQSAASPFSALASKPSTPANDSFSNLLASNKTKQNATVTMQERQRQLLEERARQEEARRKQFDTHFGMNDATSSAVGSGTGTPNPTASNVDSPPNGTAGLSAAINKPFAGLSHNKVQNGSEGDLLAAFDADAPVDKSSHFPAAASHDSRSNTPAESLNNGFRSPPPQSSLNDFASQDEDDPFGLGSMAQKAPTPQPQPQVESAVNDDDDFLGLLGKPVAPRREPISEQPRRDSSSSEPDKMSQPEPSSLDPRDKAVAELVDMGFPAEKAAEALAQTESGVNVQSAVGILLNQAHEEAKQKSRGNPSDRRPSPHVDDPRAERSSQRGRGDGAVPSWMREERSQSGQRRSNNQSPSQDKDVSQYATEIGSSVWKSANSLWKTSQKKVQKAVADFNSDAPADSSQPKWMRDATVAELQPPRMRQAKPDVSMTDEAAMLEGGGRPQKSSRQQQREADLTSEPQRAASRFNDLPERPASRPRSPPRSRASPGAASALPSSRGFKFDDDAATTAYTSSARRRGPTPKTASPAPQEDLFSSPQPRSQVQPKPSTTRTNGTVSTSQPVSRPAATRPTSAKPTIPPRRIPPVSPTALSSSSRHRLAGSEAFKRGDYAAAHESYSSALTSLSSAASSHPIAIIILCNRATTNIKVGDPKAAVADADQALSIIGPGLGAGESIAAGDDASKGVEKPMAEFHGKALMRKAEALEALEKWADAASTWRLAVEAGAGGAVAIQGRNRCDKAAGGGGGNVSKANGAAAPAVRSTGPTRKVAPSKSTVPLSRPQASTAQSAEAVKKLRAQHAADSRAEDEKFTLADSVDAKLLAWKGSKSDNLRALLGSMDKVLWEGAGWGKVGMQDLVMPNRVKVVYMKAIGKVHPDKIPQDATTEQRMISAAVFSTLNEAWDKFKTENGL